MAATVLEHEVRKKKKLSTLLWQKSPVCSVPAAVPSSISSLTDLGAWSQKHKQFARGHTSVPNGFPFRKPVGKNNSANTRQLVVWFIFLNTILYGPKCRSSR